MNPFVVPIITQKRWGLELRLTSHFSDMAYDFKILRFDKGASLSLHHHAIKDETWWVCSGRFRVTWIHPDTAQRTETDFAPGHAMHIIPGLDHKLECIEAGDIAEASTPDDPNDSYRIELSKPGVKA